MADEALKLMKVEEFLIWDDGTDTRYELADGVIRAMSPPSGPHSAPRANIVIVHHAALAKHQPCRPVAEAAIRIDKQTMWQADCAVTCKPILREIHDPVLVVEILSPSTRTHDLGRKLIDYKTLPSVAEIWMVDSERHWIQHWRRDPNGWLGQDFVVSAAFDSPLLGEQITLDQVCADSGLEPPLT